ncbi:hypothetical protein [Sphingomonas suaedae]|nr:hypothetical protein [Sphingomonas suaedae]
MGEIINPDEWERVGSVYRRKKKRFPWGWLFWGGVALVLLQTCS